MGDPKGFLKLKREAGQYRPVCERAADFKDVTLLRPDDRSQQQASRCMDCGTPFCHWGCPVGNYIPEWNDHMFHGRWDKAFQLLDATNGLPEITGRLCPAPCEYACVLGINDEAVTIRENELAIIEYAFNNGLIKPRPPKKRSGSVAAVVGSGPAGLSCAAELNRRGHKVTVFEKDDKIGGIMRYGIPDFKLEKWVLDRRVALLKREGIEFVTGVDVGVDYPVKKLRQGFDAVCLCGGSRVPRDLKIEGRALKGIHFAMDYLIQSNRRNAGEIISKELLIDARDKKVVIIGGGDTGSDCVGTAHRQGAKCVVQIELLSQPPECRGADFPWPRYPMILKTSSSHEEGGERRWSVLTKRFIGEQGRVKKIQCLRVEFAKGPEAACPVMKEVPGSEFEIEADLVMLAVGFAHPQHAGLLADLKIDADPRGNVKAGGDFMTNINGVFTAGDMRRGQSLIVWAIAEGRACAYSIDRFLRNV
ncbi:MAG: glutamate synthase subunit beta [Candidatus Omnitrophica bacterium]|nr:glutamate synthase subunit beta [Candidatus Omnitrophota bacterium]